MRPVAFRIRDFKSIRDTGTCHLSGDNITVLAGQNEAGKTAILSALRDFDLEIGSEPLTPDYEPDDEREGASPSVSVLFQADPRRIATDLEEENIRIPLRARLFLQRNPRVWITRDLRSGGYALDQEFAAQWEHVTPDAASPSQNRPSLAPEASEPTEDQGQEGGASSKRLLDANQFADWLRTSWPTFVYFDSFQDSLPREVDFDDLRPSKPSPQAAATAQQARRSTEPKAPAAVRDFAVLAALDIERVAGLATNDKALTNYLSSRSAAITGDFLTYWKQKQDADEIVQIKVKGLRDSEGTLKLAFLVHDQTDQYPDQRSKGFLWFLSFYLKLAAAQKKDPERRRVLLIDEPGSYLHARAQKDVLHILESRIAQTDAVIYSTHSPYLIPPDRLHRLRIVSKTAAAGTKVLDLLTHPDLRGEDHADSLSPVIAAIGIDITQSITFNKEKNLLVEGISDLMYLTAWARLLQSDFAQKFNIFPGSSATTIPTLASLFTGWGFNFVSLLDNDDQGKSIRDKLTNKLLVPAARIIQPTNAKTIEDLLSPDDFRALLHAIDDSLTLNTGETPSSAIRRQSLDKILLARTFSEQASHNKTALTKKSQEAISALLRVLSDAWEK